MFGIRSEELILILIIILVLFGGSKLPQLSKNLGEAIKELRRGFSEDLDKPDGKKSTEKKKSS
jgi:sec-independent protein translocase protein TatA